MEIINIFGGIRPLLIICIFICMFFIISSLIKSNFKRGLFSIFTSLFVALQLISLFSTQSFIGYQFFVHCNLSGITGLSGLFIPHLIGLSIFLIGLILLNYRSIRILNRKIFDFKKKTSRLKRRIYVVVFTILCCIAVSYKGTFISDSKSLFTLFVSDTGNFREVLAQNKMEDYVTPDEIESTAGKNIIIISLESIEKGYLSEKLSYLVPNLSSYKNSWNYYDINQNIGSGWTSGSMYTCLTGFPAFFGKSSNSIFQTTYDSKISSISNVLEKAGYQTTYMNGNASHSGMEYMLNAFNFNKLIDVGSVSQLDNRSDYGLRDKDLFELAKAEIDLQSKSDKPFALIISTTDTHFPNGIYDRRMEAVISEKNSDMEFMVSAVDYMTGELLEYLQEKDILENTVVYIFPDHLKMGDPTLFKDTGDRGLYLITNAEKAGANLNPSEKLYQIDLPKMILNGAEIKHNQKFLTDYIEGDKNDFIRENINNITAINTSGLSRLNAEEYVTPTISKNYEAYKTDTLRYIAHAGGMIDGYNYTNSLEALDLSYSKGFRLFEIDINKTKDGKYVALHDWESWANMTGYTGETPVTHQEFINNKLYNKYTPLGIEEINTWFQNHKDAILVSDKINEPKLFSQAFIDPSRLIMELFTQQAIEEGNKTEIRSSMATQHVIAKMDWDLILELDIKHVAISRFFIASHKALLKKLKENNIKVFVYDVNRDQSLTDSGMDEDYVTKYELDYVYGMYADQWSF